MTDAALDALAVYRITRLITEDTLTEPPRLLLQAELKRRGHIKLAYLLGCPWCSGFWVAVAVGLVRWRAPRAWQAVRWPLAMSAAAGVIAERV